MRILLLSYGYGENEVSESLTSFKISKEIQKHCEVKILTKDNATASNIVNIKTRPFFKNTPFYRAIKPDYPEFIFKAYQYARQHLKKFDIIHHISPISFRYPNPLCNLNKPFIWGPVGGSIPYPKGFEAIEKREPFFQGMKKLDRLRLKWDPLMVSTLKKSTKIILTCKAALNNLPTEHKNKAIVIPEGIDLTSRLLARSSEKNYIFSSGRLVPYKGFELLIRAFTKSRLPSDTKLLITGDGQEIKFLQKLIHNLGINNRVELLGKVSKNDNLELIRKSLFCVFPALNEAFGHVNLEAMSMKKPIIVTDNGGPADIVEEGVTGFKISSGSISEYIDALTIKLNVLYSDRNLRNEMAEKAYNRIWKIYSWENIGIKYMKIYNDILKENHGL